MGKPGGWMQALHSSSPNVVPAHPGRLDDGVPVTRSARQATILQVYPQSAQTPSESGPRLQQSDIPAPKSRVFPCPEHVAAGVGAPQAMKKRASWAHVTGVPFAACPAPRNPCTRGRHGLLRHLDRRRRPHGRRSGVQHRAHWLPGNPHRPELLPADRDAHVSAHRQLRRQCRGQSRRRRSMPPG
jgi:hypothetical protein